VSEHIKIIKAGPEHRNFVLKSFAIEYSKQHHISKNAAAGKMATLMDAWKTIVATVDGAGDEILGYLVYRDRGMLAWVYVKHQYRRHGVAKALLAHADVWPGSVDVAFFSPHGASLAKDRGYTLRWRPYAPDVELEAWANVSKLIEEAARLESEERHSSVTLAGSSEAEGE
jgi:GNAT superfamily N-acetyltransferase